MVTAVVLWLRLRRPSPAMTNKVDKAYGPVATQIAERRDQIARAWTQATQLSSLMQGAIGVLLVVTAVVVVAAAVGVLWIGKDLITDVPWLVDLAISAFVLGLVAVGRRAYRSPALRRSVGIAWDLGTFWPRAVHPLAPPSARSPTSSSVCATTPASTRAGCCCRATRRARCSARRSCCRSRPR